MKVDAVFRARGVCMGSFGGIFAFRALVLGSESMVWILKYDTFEVKAPSFFEHADYLPPHEC